MAEYQLVRQQPFSGAERNTLAKKTCFAYLRRALHPKAF